LCFCIWIIIYYCPFVLDLVHQSTNGWNLARLIIGVFYRSYEFPFFFGYQKFSKFPVFNIRIPCRNKWEDLLYECLPWRSHPQPLLQQEQRLTYYRVCLCYWELQFFEMQIYKDRVRAFCGYAFKFFLSLCKCMLVTYWFVSVHRYIRRAKPDAGFPLFQSESLKWPGFVEFDDVNAKVLTYSAQDRYFPSLFLFLFHFYCVFFHRLFYLTRFYPMTTVYTRSLILKTTLCYTRFQIGTFKRSKSGTFLVLDWFSALLFRYLQKLHFDKLILSSHDHNHYHILHHTKHITSKKKYFKEVKVLAK
jgi:hypothetical protein